MKNRNKVVHFMGVGGSGMSGVAVMAKRQGYEVTGCDLEKTTPYLEKVKKAKIKVYLGHDKKHLTSVNILAVSPAVFFQNDNHPEAIEGKRDKIIMSWQEFLGRHLQKGKRVICVSGTHGKSTTTAMASLLFEKAKLDPNVMIGATVPKWNSNYRVGKSEIFITESDEFYDNFLHYNPETIVLNNIEFDHPDYFKNEKQLFLSFSKHLKNLKSARNLIFNQDSEGIKRLFDENEGFIKKLNLIGYTLGKPVIKTKVSFRARVKREIAKETVFKVKNEKFGINYEFKLVIPGRYNVSNSLGVIVLGRLYNISAEDIYTSLKNFSGIGRRMELISKKKGILVYDDYAHHPTAIRETLIALKQRHSESRIFAIIEPHTYSRTKALLKEYRDIFTSVNRVIIAPIFRSRDSETFGVNGDDIVKMSGHKNIIFVDSFEKIVEMISSEARKDDVIIVMGAGKSYELARSIVEKI